MKKAPPEAHALCINFIWMQNATFFARAPPPVALPASENKETLGMSCPIVASNGGLRRATGKPIPFQGREFHA
jgi:hypothetical protein